MNNSISRGNCVVFGGHSPIALSISKKLSTHYKVTHITRNVDSEISKIQSTSLSLREFNIQNALPKDLEKVLDVLNLNSADTLIFCHRFRGTLDLEQSFVTEVVNPFKLSERWLESSLGSKKNLIFFTSPAHFKTLSDQDVAYHINKSAIAKLVSYLAVTYAQQNINVFGISPGSFVEKQRSKSFYESNQDLYRKITDKIPRRKFVKSDEIAEIIDLLCTNNFGLLSGSIFELDNLSRFVEFSSVLK